MLLIWDWDSVKDAREQLNSRSDAPSLMAGEQSKLCWQFGGCLGFRNAQIQIVLKSAARAPCTPPPPCARAQGANR